MRREKLADDFFTAQEHWAGRVPIAHLSDDPVLSYIQISYFMAHGLDPTSGAPDTSWPPGSMWDLLLRAGRFNIAQSLPERYGRGEPRMCFWNAFALADQHPEDLTYVEGFAAGVIPVMHAWCIDHEDRVIDPTWGDGRIYYGIPFDIDLVRRSVIERGVSGLLEGPWLYRADGPLKSGVPRPRPRGTKQLVRVMMSNNPGCVETHYVETLDRRISYVEILGPEIGWRLHLECGHTAYAALRPEHDRQICPRCITDRETAGAA